MRHRKLVWWIVGLIVVIVGALFVFPARGWGLGCCGWGAYGGMMGMGGAWPRGGYGGMMGPMAAWAPIMGLLGLIPVLLLGLVVAGGVWLGLTLFRGGNPAGTAMAPVVDRATCPQCGHSARFKRCGFHIYRFGRSGDYIA
jgi:hypothetical protein